jgi:hypothetical protein
MFGEAVDGPSEKDDPDVGADPISDLWPCFARGRPLCWNCSGWLDQYTCSLPFYSRHCQCEPLEYDLRLLWFVVNVEILAWLAFHAAQGCWGKYKVKCKCYFKTERRPRFCRDRRRASAALLPRDGRAKADDRACATAARCVTAVRCATVARLCNMCFYEEDC